MWCTDIYIYGYIIIQDFFFPIVLFFPSIILLRVDLSIYGRFHTGVFKFSEERCEINVNFFLSAENISFLKPKFIKKMN
jgi:hypothetical protein